MQLFLILSWFLVSLTSFCFMLNAPIKHDKKDGTSSPGAQLLTKAVGLPVATRNQKAKHGCFEAFGQFAKAKECADSTGHSAYNVVASPNDSGTHDHCQQLMHKYGCILGYTKTCSELYQLLVFDKQVQKALAICGGEFGFMYSTRNTADRNKDSKVIMAVVMTYFALKWMQYG